MYFQRSINRLFVAGATTLLLGASGLANAQLGRVNAPGTDLGNANFDWASGPFTSLMDSVTIDVTAALTWNGVGVAGPLSSRAGTFGAGVYQARTFLKDNADVNLPGSPQALVSVCNDLFNTATDDPAVDWFKLTGNEANANKNKLAYLVDFYMGFDGSDFSSIITGDTLINAGSDVDVLLNDDTMTKQQAAAGFQLAVWELWYDDGVSLAAKGLDAGARGFTATANAKVISAANAFLTDASAFGVGYTSNTAIRLRDMVTDTSFMQGMLISTRDPIPEPAFYQMAGLLTMGFLGMRRLRKKS